MADIFYRMGREARWSDLRIPSYWVADLRFFPIEFYRGIAGKKSMARQNMEKIDALKKSQEYNPETKFLSVRLAAEYHGNKKNIRYEAAESFASLPVFINGIAYIVGSVSIIGPVFRFVKGIAEGKKK